MKNDILEQIDKLKMMVMLDNTPPTPTEVEKFDHWVNNIKGRFEYAPDWKNYLPFKPDKYAKYKTIQAMVEQLYKDKFGKNREYEKNKPEIRIMIANIVAMTMFYEDEGVFKGIE